MSKMSRRCGLALAVTLACSAALQAQSRTPADATFRENAWTTSPTDKIRGDALGSYRDDGPADPDCVIAWVDNGGSFFLRTVKPNCSTTTPRSILLDFSDAESRSRSCPAVVLDDYGNSLDICGGNNVADVRVIANSLFKDTALTNGTRVTLYFSLQRDFTSTEFELDFEQPVPVTAMSATVRVLEAPAGALAELYQYVSQGRKTVKTTLGRFRMPFQLTVVKQ